MERDAPWTAWIRMIQPHGEAATSSIFCPIIHFLNLQCINPKSKVDMPFGSFQPPISLIDTDFQEVQLW
jgi:hypothetical protein